MTNPLPDRGTRPLREGASSGDPKLNTVPKIRVIGWLLVALVTLAGIILYFMYGDYVTPMIGSRDITDTLGPSFERRLI